MYVCDTLESYACPGIRLSTVHRVLFSVFATMSITIEMHVIVGI